MRTLAYIIILIGLLIYGYSLTLKPYTDEEEFYSKYIEICGDNRSEKFFKLREEYLTLKYPLADYGLTIAIVGLTLLFMFYNKWKNFKTLPSKVWIISVGFCAVIITIIAYIADLYHEISRGSAPHWADSIGIPLMNVPPMLIGLLIWFGLNLFGLKGEFKSGVSISSFQFKSINYWYLTISILTIFKLIFVLVTGYFWMLIPGILWLYFYISILIGRQAAKFNKNGNNLNN